MSDIQEAIRNAIAAQISDAQITVRSGSGGHFELEVVSKAFEGLGTLERHRLVLQSIKELMAGAQAPVHAIDSLKTRTE